MVWSEYLRKDKAVSKIWVQFLGWGDLLEKEELPTSVFWLGQFHGLYSSWDCKESDMIEQLALSLFKAVSVVIGRRKMEKHHG